MNSHLFLFALLTMLGSSTQAEVALRLIDPHSHHERDYETEFDCADVIAALDAASVERVLITSRGNHSSQLCFKRYPDRIIPFYSVYGGALDKQTWMHQPAKIDEAQAALESGEFSGIGELHIFAQDRESEVLAGLVGLARQHRLPMLIHGDAEVIETVFTLNPKARVLWAHLGTEPEIELLQQLLDRYPEGLYIDTSVRDTLLLGNPIVNGPQRNRLTPDWHAFLVRNQDRLLVAVDTYSLNRWRNYAEVADQIRLWLWQLPPSVATKLSYTNAQRFFDDSHRE